MGFISRFFAPKDVSDDISAINHVMDVIEALCNTKNPSVPQLRITFGDSNCSFRFLDVYGCAVTIYQSMIERGKAKEDDIAPLIGEAFNVDRLPTGTSISFTHDNSGEVDSFTLRGIIDLKYKKAGIVYAVLIEELCCQKNIKYKRNGNELYFLDEI
ncbi:MAG: hypothetical protein IK999_05265 [Ruminococcus sp.]|nr:hypothetical protein [Ruminococcus sp.]